MNCPFCHKDLSNVSRSNLEDAIYQCFNYSHYFYYVKDGDYFEMRIGNHILVRDYLECKIIFDKKSFDIKPVSVEQSVETINKYIKLKAFL